MIEDNVIKVRKRILAACSKVGRDPSRINLIAVSKGRTVEEIKEALACGLTEIGENKVQEVLLKYPYFKNIKWHMIGHLQSNKVRDAVKIFDLIQSLDSFDLALTINKEALRINKIQDVLLEVKISPEATKFGLKPDEFPGVFEEIRKLANLKIKGLMAIAPLVDKPEDARSYFKILRKLRDRVDKGIFLSMGMTDDFEVAIEEGADIIRVGRAIFE